MMMVVMVSVMMIGITVLLLLVITMNMMVEGHRLCPTLFSLVMRQY